MKQVSMRKTAREETVSVDDSALMPAKDDVCSTALTPASSKRSDIQLGRFARIESGAVVGAGCQIGDFVRIPAWVVLEENVRIGMGVVFVERVVPEGQRYCGQEIKTTTTIMEGAVIGANSAIQRGITIGRHAWVPPCTALGEDVHHHIVARGHQPEGPQFACSCGRAIPFIGHNASEIKLCPGCHRLFRRVPRFGVFENTGAQSDRARDEWRAAREAKKKRGVRVSPERY